MYSFKCGQFDDAFKPNRLRNWQTPRWSAERPFRDPSEFKETKVIVNDNGRILPDISRADRNPWNNYVGTHDMPYLITKSIATDIATRPANCIEYLDKPNPIKPTVKEPSLGLKFKPGSSRLAEGPDSSGRIRVFPKAEDYVEHDRRIKEAAELVKEYVKCRKVIAKEEAERCCRARELERELWLNRECQRKAELHQDLDWLRKSRKFSNIVPRQNNWSEKGQPPRTGLGIDSPLFGAGGEDVDPRAFYGGFKGQTGENMNTKENMFEKKRKSSIKISEEEARTIYKLCEPDLGAGQSQIHRVVSEDEVVCEPYNASSLGASSERCEIREGGVGVASNLNVQRSSGGGGVGGGGGGPTIEFYCPVPRTGAPRPVVTGELIDPNVKEGGYVSKKFQQIRGDRLPEHDCSQGCRTPEKCVVNGCSNGGGCNPTTEQSTQSPDFGRICQNGGCSPSPEGRKFCLSPVQCGGNHQKPVNSDGNEFDPEYSQFENTDELLTKPQFDVPPVDTGFSGQANCSPNISSLRSEGQLCEDNPNPYIIGGCQPKTLPRTESPILSGDYRDRKRAVEILPGQTGLSVPPTATSLPPTKPPPPTPNVGAQFSLIGDPSQLCQPSAPPQRAPPAAPTALAAGPAATVAAKELKNANLEHQPLADAVNEAGFCRLAGRGHPNPGIALDVVPAASGIGWRPFDAPGPTNCSKQRVYRPHTAGCGMHNTQTGAAFARAARPSTSASRRRHVSAMELAIGWDTIPDYPEDEPRPPKHVDGSNGSAAPGIFCRVPAPEQTPDLPTPPLMRTAINHEPNSDEIKTRLAILQRDRAMSAAIEACRRAGAGDQRRRSACGDPRNLEDHIGAGLKASTAAMSAARRRLPKRALPRRADEQVSEPPRGNRSCEACAAPNCDEPSNSHRLPPAPFKAGKAPVCLSTNSSFNGGGSSGSGWDAAAAKALNVPRPRHPFCSRGYQITTLAQPFALDKNGSAGGAYPEHWRLASVYQLSYKPMISRNKPLMKTVFQ